MSNYKVIQDEDKLDEFINWLPELKEEETYYLALVARKKYTHGCNDTPMLRRFTATKDQMKNRIRQLECPIGAFVDRDGSPIPQGALALYITPNPRSQKKAFFETIQALVREIAKNGWRGPRNVAMNAIAKSKSRSCFAHIDVDLDKPSDSKITLLKDSVVKIVGEEAPAIIRTKGGCHVLIVPSLVKSAVKNWHPEVVKTLGEDSVDQTGDMFCPVVGCTQGDFVPYFV